MNIYGLYEECNDETSLIVFGYTNNACTDDHIVPIHVRYSTFVTTLVRELKGELPYGILTPENVMEIHKRKHPKRPFLFTSIEEATAEVKRLSFDKIDAKIMSIDIDALFEDHIRRIFISHPMSELTENEVMPARQTFYKYLCSRKMFKDKLVCLIDNYHHENVPEDADRLWHLGTSITMMGKADYIYFGNINNMKESPGVKIEREICKFYGLKVLNDYLGNEFVYNTYLKKLPEGEKLTTVPEHILRKIFPYIDKSVVVLDKSDGYRFLVMNENMNIGKFLSPSSYFKFIDTLDDELIPFLFKPQYIIEISPGCTIVENAVFSAVNPKSNDGKIVLKPLKEIMGDCYIS